MRTSDGWVTDPQLASLKEGDIITIPKDQYGQPKLRVDPLTRKVKEPHELQTFRVVSVEHDVRGNIILAKLEAVQRPL